MNDNYEWSCKTLMKIKYDDLHHNDVSECVVLSFYRFMSCSEILNTRVWRKSSYNPESDREDTHPDTTSPLFLLSIWTTRGRIRSLDDASSKEMTILDIGSWIRLSSAMILSDVQILEPRWSHNTSHPRLVQSIRHKAFAKPFGIPWGFLFEIIQKLALTILFLQKVKVHPNLFLPAATPSSDNVVSISLISCYTFFFFKKTWYRLDVFTKSVPCLVYDHSGSSVERWKVYVVRTEHIRYMSCRLSTCLRSIQIRGHLRHSSSVLSTRLLLKFKCLQVFARDRNDLSSIDRNMIHIQTDNFLELSINVIWSDPCLLIPRKRWIFDVRVPADLQWSQRIHHERYHDAAWINYRFASLRANSCLLKVLTRKHIIFKVFCVLRSSNRNIALLMKFSIFHVFLFDTDHWNSFASSI